MSDDQRCGSVALGVRSWSFEDDGGVRDGRGAATRRWGMGKGEEERVAE